MSGKPLVALILLAALSLAACQAQNGSGTSQNDKSGTDIIRAGGMGGGGGGGGGY